MIRNPHSTVEVRDPNSTEIEERFQAALQLHNLYSLPIYQLPPEILENIFDRLDLDDFPALIAAAWHLLRHSGVAPIIPSKELKEILLWPRHGFYGSIEHAIDPSRADRGYIPRQLRRPMFSRLAPLPSFFLHFTDMRRRMRGGFQRVPVELFNHIFRHADIETMINVTLASFRFSDRHIEWLTHEEV